MHRRPPHRHPERERRISGRFELLWFEILRSRPGRRRGRADL